MNDSSIIELFIKRSEQAITMTAEKYGKYLNKISWNILHNHEDVEECVNDTYLSAWKQIPPDKPERFLPYLGRITRALSLNKYNYYKAKKRNSQFDMVLSELEDCLMATETVESSLDAMELSKAINTFLKSIKKEHRIIFVRRYWYSDSIKDIAKIRQTSESNVKSILFRVRKKLESYLIKEGVLDEQ
ncbi:sigma-70 family RNA polymerase sigma factor [Acidaminobacter sp. JC074]|uniref:RNA polymerase sigma factor n=1 Tax=Acidaminobacter sp. JC074 TaxID=2530199 RepID=UPI001F0FC5F1|nr:sigma-70 family RNA polymerase sigma factor [Acidaminobacter sp. JC074]MCH4887021.1 sigma-70 family RNA polymerase sigma factor [Acidaminobacter sp. JC074]